MKNIVIITLISWIYLTKEIDAHCTEYKLIDCVYGIKAISKYYEQVGTGSGADRLKLQQMQAIAGSKKKE